MRSGSLILEIADFCWSALCEGAINDEQHRRRLDGRPDDGGRVFGDFVRPLHHDVLDRTLLCAVSSTSGSRWAASVNSPRLAVPRPPPLHKQTHPTV